MGSYNISVDLTNCLTVEPGLFDPSVDVEDEKSSSLYFSLDVQNRLTLKQSRFANKIEKPDGVRPMVKALWTDLPENEEGNQLRFLKNDKETKKTLILDLGNAMRPSLETQSQTRWGLQLTTGSISMTRRWPRLR